MKFPNLDLASLPGLETAQGLFGSATQMGALYDDTTVAIMVYVYDNMSAEMFG